MSDRRKPLVAVVTEGGVTEVTGLGSLQSSASDSTAGHSSGSQFYTAPLPSLASRRSSYDSTHYSSMASASEPPRNTAAPTRRIQTPNKVRPDPAPAPITPPASRVSRVLTTPANESETTTYKNKVYAVLRDASVGSTVFEREAKEERQGGVRPHAGTPTPTHTKTLSRISSLKGKMAALERQLDKMPGQAQTTQPASDTHNAARDNTPPRRPPYTRAASTPESTLRRRLSEAQAGAAISTFTEHTQDTSRVLERRKETADSERAYERGANQPMDRPSGTAPLGVPAPREMGAEVEANAGACKAEVGEVVPQYEVQVLRDNLQHEEARTVRLRASLSFAERSAERSAEEVTVLQEALETKTRMLESVSRELAMHTTSVREERSLLDEKIEALQDRLACAESTTTTTTAVEAHLKAQLADSDAQLRAAHSSAAEAHALLLHLKREADEANARCNIFAEEKQLLESQVGLLKEDFARLSEYVEEQGAGAAGEHQETLLKVQVDMRCALEEKQNTINALHEEVAELSSDLTLFRTHFEQKDSELQRMKEAPQVQVCYIISSLLPPLPHSIKTSPPGANHYHRSCFVRRLLGCGRYCR